MKIFNINLLNKNIHILNLIIFNLLYIQSNCEKTAIIINNNNKNMGWWKQNSPFCAYVAVKNYPENVGYSILGPNKKDLRIIWAKLIPIKRQF